MIPAHPFQALNRSREILTILLRQGFGELIERVGIPTPYALKKEETERPESHRLSAPARLREGLELLGPTFVKLGQVLSTRPDLIPREYLDEFAKLQDQVPPVPYAEIAEVVRVELGRGPDEIFAAFDPVPLAAASLAQVHRATARDGTPVAVKIQRPHIREQVRADLDLLYFLARLLEERIPELKHYRPTRIIDEFKYVLTRELDYAIELRNIERFLDHFRDSAELVIPRPFPAWSSRRVLTMEYLPGRPLAESFTAPAAERKRLSELGLTVFFKQLFVHGFFHADPHPGNIQVLPDGRLALVDFGMVGRVMPDLKYKLAGLLTALVEKNHPEIAAAVLEISEAEEEINQERFVRDIADIVDYHYSERLADLRVGEALESIVTIALTHRLRLPANLSLMVKCLLTVESLGRRLDPDLNFIAAIRPCLKELVLEKYGLHRAIETGFDTLRDFTRLTLALPRDLRFILRKLKSGEMTIEFKHRNLEKLISALEHSSNRVSFSLVIAALVIGSSVIMATGGDAGAGYPLLGIFGYIFAALLGLWLIVMIIRSGKI